MERTRRNAATSTSLYSYDPQPAVATKAEQHHPGRGSTVSWHLRAYTAQYVSSLAFSCDLVLLYCWLAVARVQRKRLCSAPLSVSDRVARLDYFALPLIASFINMMAVLVVRATLRERQRWTDVRQAQAALAVTITVVLPVAAILLLTFRLCRASGQPGDQVQSLLYQVDQAMIAN